MQYLLYSLVFLTLASGTLLYLTRAHWLPALQETFARVVGGGGSSPSSFEDDMEAGLSSANFDLTGNVEGGDGRAGLDDAAKREILRIMKKRRLVFDEARRVYMEQRFRENGIGPDGRPRDPKFVSFS